MTKTHSTNYLNTFIEVAEDCPVLCAEEPPLKEPPSSARLEYQMLAGNPYRYTSDEVIFETKGAPKGLSWDDFFSKGQPCMRASALTKRYGWGVHCSPEGTMALVPLGSEDYDRLAADPGITHLKAMRMKK